MRLMRVKLPEGMKDTDLGLGKVGFTVTGDLVEWSTCADTANCRERALLMKNDDGTPQVRRHPARPLPLTPCSSTPSSL